MSAPLEFHPLLLPVALRCRHLGINFSTFIANTVIALRRSPPPTAVPHAADSCRYEIYRSQDQEVAAVNFELATWRQHQARLGNDHHGQDGLEGQRHERIYAEN